MVKVVGMHGNAPPRPAISAKLGVVIITKNWQNLPKSTKKYFNILRPGKRQIMVVIITEN